MAAQSFDGDAGTTKVSVSGSVEHRRYSSYSACITKTFIVWIDTMVKEFLWPIRVYYEDTDSGGVVYYANYLKFMERARTEWLRSLGFEQDHLRQEMGLLFAVRRASLEFRQPARFNDALKVASRIERMGKASLTFRQEIYREVDEQLLCDGEIVVACLDAARFRPAPIPVKLLAGFEDDV